MKILINLFAIIILLFLLFYFLFRTTYSPAKKSSDPLMVSPTAESANNEQTTTNEADSMKVQWVEISDVDKIQLYSNLKEKETSVNLITLKNCETLVSAGFFTKENKHIGYFFSENQIISTPTDNSFYNGFFSIYSDRKIKISEIPPENERLSLQSGPILLQNGKVTKLDINNDESARRVVVAISERLNRVYLMIIYSSNNHVLGPKLMELPEVIKRTSDGNQLLISSALNLDGGSHSAFITRGVKVSELSTIGGYFCINP